MRLSLDLGLGSVTLNQGGGVWSGLRAAPYHPVGGRNGIMGAWSTTRFATQSSVAARTGTKPVSGIKMGFTNWIVLSSGAEEANTVALTCSGSIKIDGVYYPATVDGNASFSVPAGETVWADVLGLTIPASTAFEKISLIDAGSGNHYPYNTIMKSGVDRVEDTTTTPLTDKTQSGTIGTGGSFLAFTPILIGEIAGKYPSFVVLGDSIAYGTSENNSTGGDANGNHGWLERLIEPLGYGMMSLSRGSVAASQLTEANMAQRLAILDLMGTHFISAMASNDLNLQNQTAAQLIANQEEIFGWLPDGFRKGVTTSLPATNTDGTNVAPRNGTVESRRLTYNAAVRSGTGIAGQDFYVDPDSVAGTVDGIWADTSWQGDGTHPTQTGHAAIAAGLTLPVVQ